MNRRGTIAERREQRSSARHEKRDHYKTMDGELVFVELEMRQETRQYAEDIYRVIESLGTATVGNIHKALGWERVRMFDAAIALLVERIETIDGGSLTRYRCRDLRLTPKVNATLNPYAPRARATV